MGLARAPLKFSYTGAQWLFMLSFEKNLDSKDPSGEMWRQLYPQKRYVNDIMVSELLCKGSLYSLRKYYMDDHASGFRIQRSDEGNLNEGPDRFESLDITNAYSLWISVMLS